MVNWELPKSPVSVTNGCVNSSNPHADNLPRPPFPSAVALVIDTHAPLIDTDRAHPLALEAAVAAMAPATRSAITSDLRCFLKWCAARCPAAVAVPAAPETLVHYLRWLDEGTAERPGAKPATLARRLASIARIHRVLGFGESEPLPTQAGMVRDTIKAINRTRRQRQRQAAPLRLGPAMHAAETPPDGVTVQALLASCTDNLSDLRDAALISLAYDAGLRVSELVDAEVRDVRQSPDGSGRLEIRHSKTDQTGEGALAWVSSETMMRISSWLRASGLTKGAIFRRINVLPARRDGGPQEPLRYFVGARPLSRQGVVAILRRRVLAANDLGHFHIEPGCQLEVVRGMSAHSFRVGLTQDLFAAGEDGAGIALALRWSSPTTALRYARELAVGGNAAARVLGRMRSGRDCS